ncbi:MAG: hypothetical protein FD127_4522 [Acidimicrobiaceae bacterium]|nr:MAG: hypothetical protein FD127_4522 [Acidimicrobiaceae bacterium]
MTLRPAQNTKPLLSLVKTSAPNRHLWVPANTGAVAVSVPVTWISVFVDHFGMDVVLNAMMSSRVSYHICVENASTAAVRRFTTTATLLASSEISNKVVGPV